MKVLHLGKYFPPDVYGGIESVNFSLMEAGIEDGAHIDSLVFGVNSSGVIDFSTGNSVYSCKRDFLVRSAPVSVSYVRTWMRICDRYDIIHLHYPNPLAELCISLRKPRGKLLVHWHSDVISQLFLKKLISPLTRRVLCVASKVVCTSERYSEASSDLKGFESKIEIIPIGVKPIPYLKEDRVLSLRSKYSVKHIVFSLGRLIHYKGFEYLISSAQFLDDDFMVIIGGEGELETKLRYMAQNLGVANRVKFLGRMSYEEVVLHFNACDVFCLPSITRAEAFGVVQAEAMSVGMPVVSADINGSGVPWVNECGVSGIVVSPKSDRELANGIKLAILDRAALSEGARKRYQENFTEVMMHKKFAKLYSELVEI